MKSRSILLVALLLVSAFHGHEAAAGAPYCATHNGNGYCQYVGKVAKAYVNTHDQILVYFDTPLDLAGPSNVGLAGVTRSGAAVVVISDNPEFAKFFYSSVLSAQARDVNVTMQFRSASSGYLVADRIWVAN